MGKFIIGRDNPEYTSWGAHGYINLDEQSTGNLGTTISIGHTHQPYSTPTQRIVDSPTNEAYYNFRSIIFTDSTYEELNGFTRIEQYSRSYEFGRENIEITCVTNLGGLLPQFFVERSQHVYGDINAVATTTNGDEYVMVLNLINSSIEEDVLRQTFICTFLFLTE